MSDPTDACADADTPVADPSAGSGRGEDASLSSPNRTAAPSGLTLTGLAVARGGIPVLVGIDAQVPPGGALVLRGPNGAGKTTLLRTLAGLQPPVAGTVAPGPGAMAYASHADGTKGTLTVAENLRFWARVHGHDEIAPALDAFALAPLADRPAATLSAGQRRRLGLARMTLTRRPVWLFDEPTVSLDAASVGQFADAVRAHLARGGIAVIATHIDLALPEAQVLDVAPYRARPDTPGQGAPAARDAGFAGAEDGGAFL
jgi:heme exporter protein A